MLLGRARSDSAVSAACKRETALSEVHLLLKRLAQRMAACLRGLGACALLTLACADNLLHWQSRAGDDSCDACYTEWSV
jgi:hypothetical protein